MKKQMAFILFLLLITIHVFAINSYKKPLESSVNTQLKVSMSDGTSTRFFRIYYLSQNVTKGFDNGYDGETFGGIANVIDIYTQLVAENDGKKYQVQSLPLQDISNMIIPVGIKAQTGKQLVITTELTSFPGGLNVYFEDKLTNTITRIDQVNTNYTFITDAAIDGFGRFFLYVSASEPVINSTWNGSINNTWSNADNWSDGVPTAIVNAIIPDVLNAPIISSTTKTTINNLIINEPDSVLIQSGGALIVNGTATGNITYSNTLSTENWYLISSPVSGETYNNAFVAANNLAINGSNNAIATYSTLNNSWVYMQTGTENTFMNGIGYSVRRATGQGGGTISFTGTINTSTISTQMNNAGNGFNLVGNPYTSYLDNTTFITDNSANIYGNQIWVWNQLTNNYEVKNLAETIILAPTQGFFVKAVNAVNLNFIKFRQVTTGDNFQKTAKTEIVLTLSDGTNNRFAKLYYFDANASKGFDNGYDGETFSGQPNSVDIFTHLLEGSVGKNYQVQSLPKTDMESMIVPVGIIAGQGKEITFTADALNLPNDLKVFLEDRDTNTFTELTSTNNYKVTLNAAVDGIGRFYMHTASSALSAPVVDLTNVNIYTTSKNNLRITGVNSDATVKVFNILGKQVFENSFSSKGVTDLNLPAVQTGVYIIQLTTTEGKLNKKIVLE